MIRAATLLLALLIVTPLAAAANFPGWTRTYSADNITITSPRDANGMVNFLLTTTNEPEKEDPKVAFRKMVDSAIASLDGDMRLARRSAMRAEGGMIVEALKVGVPGGEVDLLVFAYDTGNKFWEAGMLAYVSAIADADPRVNHALDFIATAARTKYRMTDPRAFDRTAPQAQSLTAYTTTKTAPPPPPMPAAPPPQPQQSGKKCERRPIWGFRMSYFCQPTGICPDRVIKGYETVCE